MTHFLLPCECGQKLEVTAAQAGKQLTCDCGRAIDVPTLRGLQSLERTVDAAAPTPRRWGARQGSLLLGATIAVLSLIAAAGLEYFRPNEWIVVARQLPAHDPSGESFGETIIPMTDFDRLTPAEVWMTWKVTTPFGADRRLSKLGLYADAAETHWVLAWRDWRHMVWILGGLGVAIVALTLLIPARSVRRPAARKRAGAKA